MPDGYHRFADLAAAETEGVDYRIRLVERASPVAIVAPHGGNIERGTSLIAEAIAANAFSLYCFEGLVPGRPHSELHITSTRFDEPVASRLAGAAQLVVGIHGRKDGDDGASVWLGGLDVGLRDAVREALQDARFSARSSGHHLLGEDPRNICNRGLTRTGIQLEIPRTLRRGLEADPGLLGIFATAVRSAISERFPMV